MRKKTYLLVVVTILLFSCNERNEKEGIRREFHSNGKLASEIEYKDSLKDGVGKTYYFSGKLAEEGTFRKGKSHGSYKAYYEDGKLKEQGQYEAGNPIGSFYYLYSSGKYRLYNAFDYNENVFYVIKFDSLGNKLKEEGHVIAPTVLTPNVKSEYRNKDSIVLNYIVAEPPGYKSKVSVGIYSYKEKKLNNQFQNIPIKNSIAIYRNIAPDVGHYDVICIGELLDTITNVRKLDTAHTDIFVR